MPLIKIQKYTKHSQVYDFSPVGKIANKYVWDLN